ncbi:MAG: hypothetical protein RL757_33 [Bacteroidota bacterium]|jgi:hypothetical protein
MKSLLGIGTRVKFSTSRDSGVVTDKLGDGMLLVMLDGHNMEIPAFESDLIRQDSLPQNINPSANSLDSKVFGGWDLEALNNEYQQNTHSKNDNYSTLDERSIPSDLGFLLVLESSKNAAGELESFDLHLLNATNQAVIFDFELLLNDKSEQLESGALAPATVEQKISRLEWDELNDHPNIRLRITPIYTEGGGAVVEKLIKIRPQAISKNTRQLPFWRSDLAVFLIAERFSFQNLSENSADNLKKYTNQLVNLNKKKAADSVAKQRLIDTTPNVQEFANFQKELDLHIEMLVEHHRELNNVEIINTQLIIAQRFVDHAVRLGIDHIFLIHGIGTGRLRDLLAARLRRNPNVRFFKNEYHEKYGWGATQVFIK